MCDNVLNYFGNANQNIKDKLKFVLSYIADEKHPLCEPYVKHISTAKYSLFYEIRIKVAKEIVRVIFYLADNDIVLLYTFCKNDKRDTNKNLESVYRLFESGAFIKTDFIMLESIEWQGFRRMEILNFYHRLCTTVQAGVMS